MTTPMPIRFEKELLELLDEGAARTRHKKQELIRITLRRHLRKVIDEEASGFTPKRLTNIEPWPKGALAAAYKKIAAEKWDEIELAVGKGRRKLPSMDD